MICIIYFGGYCTVLYSQVRVAGVEEGLHALLALVVLQAVQLVQREARVRVPVQVAEHPAHLGLAAAGEVGCRGRTEQTGLFSNSIPSPPPLDRGGGGAGAAHELRAYTPGFRSVSRGYWHKTCNQGIP